MGRPSRQVGRRARSGLSALACARRSSGQAVLRPRAALAFAITIAMGSLGPETDANTIESRKAPLNRDQDDDEAEIPREFIHLLLVVPACLGNGFYTIGQFFGR